MIGLVASVEVDTSETGSPVCGTGGNHFNEASGGVGEGPAAGAGIGASAGVTATGGVTVKVTGPLLPAGPPASGFGWVATAVYFPLDRAGLALPDVQPAPVPVAVAVETTVPFAAAPE